MKILLTGNKGGIGSAIEEKLKQCNIDYTGIDKETNLYSFMLNNLHQYDSIITAHGINLPKDPSFSYQDPEMETNFRSVISLARAWVKDHTGTMQQRKIFIAIVSNSAFIPRSNSLYYCASKAALDMGLKVLQRNYCTLGFEFYSLCPGLVDTPMTKEVFKKLTIDDQKEVLALQEAINKMPMKRIIRPDEIAEWVYFILSNPAAILASGSSLHLDSGEI